jgi:site-specific DNA recombinase
MKVRSNPGPLRAIIYTRVSTGGQTENTSLAGQYEACKRKALDMGAAIVGVYEETKSGGLYLTRGELQKALAAIESGEANILVLSKLDRTGREVDSLRDIRRRVENAGAALVFADGMNFEKNAVGNLMFTQMGAFAEFEREMIKERMTMGLERTARSGRQPARARSPYGYRIWQKADVIRGECGADEAGTYILVEAEARWVRIIFDRIAAQESLRSVCAWLTLAGAETRGGRVWSPGTIRGMIKNPAYKGKPAWRKTRRVVDESRAAQGVGIDRETQRPESEWVTIPAPAIVDEATWAKANEVLERGREERSGRNDHRYLLSGLLWCTRCGRRVCSYATHVSSGNERTHLYRCMGMRKRQTQSVQRCDTPTFMGPPLDAMVITTIIEMLSKPEMIREAQRQYEVARKADASVRSEQSRMKYLVREIESCARKESIAADKEVEAIMNGMDGCAYAKVRNESQQKRNKYELELKALQSAVTGDVSPPPISSEVASIISVALQDSAITDARKGILLRHIVNAVYPIILTDELRVNARARRENRDEKALMKNRMSGGVEIVLETEKGPVFILTRKIIDNEYYTDKKGRKNALRPVWETSLRVESENPFPPKLGRASAVLNRELRRQE